MNPEERLAYIEQVLGALKGAWLVLAMVIDGEIASLTERLVNEDDEQIRGRIKALRDLKELPSTLSSERDGIRAALSDEDAAD